MARKIKATAQPTHAEIAALAEEIYRREGCVPGRDLDNWLRAETALRAGVANAPGASPERLLRARTR